jgi:hypothetical protein
MSPAIAGLRRSWMSIGNTKPSNDLGGELATNDQLKIKQNRWSYALG